MPPIAGDGIEGGAIGGGASGGGAIGISIGGGATGMSTGGGGASTGGGGGGGTNGLPTHAASAGTVAHYGSSGPVGASALKATPDDALAGPAATPGIAATRAAATAVFVTAPRTPATIDPPIEPPLLRRCHRNFPTHCATPISAKERNGPLAEPPRTPRHVRTVDA